MLQWAGNKSKLSEFQVIRWNYHRFQLPRTLARAHPSVYLLEHGINEWSAGQIQLKEIASIFFHRILHTLFTFGIFRLISICYFLNVGYTSQKLFRYVPGSRTQRSYNKQPTTRASDRERKKQKGKEKKPRAKNNVCVRLQLKWSTKKRHLQNITK